MIIVHDPAPLLVPFLSSDQPADPREQRCVPVPLAPVPPVALLEVGHPESVARARAAQRTERMQLLDRLRGAGDKWMFNRLLVTFNQDDPAFYLELRRMRAAIGGPR